MDEVCAMLNLGQKGGFEYLPPPLKAILIGKVALASGKIYTLNCLIETINFFWTIKSISMQMRIINIAASDEAEFTLGGFLRGGHSGEVGR